MVDAMQTATLRADQHVPLLEPTPAELVKRENAPLLSGEVSGASIRE
jgi:hypothetical protein